MSAVMDDFAMIDIGLIVRDETNPRKHFDEDKMAELEASVRVHGIIQPLIVREDGNGGFEIVAGERRWTVAGRIGLDVIPCRVKDLTDLEVAEIQLAENIDRDDLDPLEESAGVVRLTSLGMNPDTVAQRMCRSDEWVQLRLDLPRLPEVAKDALRSGKIGLGAARRVLRLDDEDREDASQRLLELDGVLSEATVADIIRSRYEDPKRRREAWEKLIPLMEKKFPARATAIADVECSPEYVMPWGEGVGCWVPVQDEIGGLSARPVESVVMWSDLVDVHGIETVLVCAGGEVEMESVVEVVDRRVVIDAERALKDQGRPHTIGQRKTEPAPHPDEDDDEETFEELAVRCVADAILNDPENDVLVGILSPVLAASEIQTAADDFVNV